MARNCAACRCILAASCGKSLWRGCIRWCVGFLCQRCGLGRKAGAIERFADIRENITCGCKITGNKMYNLNIYLLSMLLSESSAQKSHRRWTRANCPENKRGCKKQQVIRLCFHLSIQTDSSKQCQNGSKSASAWWFSLECPIALLFSVYVVRATFQYNFDHSSMIFELVFGRNVPWCKDRRATENWQHESPRQLAIM